MNNQQVNQLIQGIGVLTELWMITYQGFKQQGLNDNEAMAHTKAFMSVTLGSFFDSNGKVEGKDDPS